MKPYGENVYELSSRSRVTETSLPGITERDTLSTKASPNGYLPILSFDSATQSLSANGYHGAGRFTVGVTTGADGSLAESWTDEFGTPVLERVRISTTGSGSGGQWAETCYVKDRRGRILCVIPPEEFAALCAQAAAGNGAVASFSAEHCYTYAYDGRDRVVSRHLPDQAQETLSYNDADLVTSKVRTAVDGTGTETFVTDYDIFNRPEKERYRYGSGNTVTLIRYAYDTARDTLKAGDTSRPIPSFSAVSGIATTSDKDARTKGLKTAELVRILPAGESETAMASDNNAQYIARSYHYDKKGNVIQVAESRPDVGVTARTSAQYGFAGKVLKTRETADLPASGGGTVTNQLDESFSYDSRLRPTSHSAKLTSSGTAGSLAVFNHQHDALGRPYVAMRLIANAMDVTTDTYTIQGWLKSSSGPSFEETLFYDAPSRTATDALPGKAGLITEWTSWQKGTTANGAAPLSSTYTYEYDGAGRLVGSSRYGGTSTSPLATLTEKDITYDRSGSLLSIKRYGATSGTTAADSLSFTYTGTKRSGYTYDAHGNVTADPVSGTALAWNVIGLPKSVSDGTDTARRVYAADGSLLAVYSGTAGTEGRVRIGSFDVLSSSTGALSLESAGWEGGRLLPGTGYDKVLYHVTDHLGSVRVVKDGTGAVLQRFDYYPFGSVSGSWASGTNPSQPSLRYRFSGKEIAGQSVDASLVASALAGTPAAAAGTPYLDFGARLYDPRSAAWLSQDPMAEKYYAYSPYSYCAGSPIALVDLHGKSLDSYIFSQSGSFLQHVVDGLEDRILVMLDNGYYLEASFVDSINDPHSINENTKLVIVSDEEIAKMLTNAGAYNPENQGVDNAINYLLIESDNSNLKGNGNLDFTGNGRNNIETENTLYLTHTYKNGFVAHNGYNFGNFLWGASADALGVPLWVARLGAHAHNFFKDPNYKWHLDSKDDQQSICIGYNWGKYSGNKVFDYLRFVFKYY